MKKIILTLAAAACMLSAQAGITPPYDFSSDFAGKNPLKGWTIYAPEGKPTGTYPTAYFPNYSPSNAVQIIMMSEYGAWTCSQYANLQKSDTWLITPEFEVTNETSLLNFTVEIIGMTQNQVANYYVYISEGGTAKEDFQLFEQGGLAGATGGVDYTRAAQKRLHLDGYKGKKIRVAFVNQGNLAGMMGFSEISVGSWYITKYPTNEFFNSMIFNSSEPNTLDFSFRASTPETTKSYTLEFKTSGNYTYKETFEKSFRFNSVTSVTVSLTDIPLTQEIEDYTLTITPDFEGAKPLVCTGYLVRGSRDYDYVGVMEDATGTWCQFCPYGIAGLEYYSHMYNGKDGAHRAIPIGLHMFDNFQIPETISDYVVEYYTQFFGANGGSFPFVAVNRKLTTIPSPRPTVIGTALSSLYDLKSFAKITLDAVYYNPVESPKMWANYSLQTSFNTAYCPVSVSAVLVEDHVQGTSSEDDQINVLAGTMTAASVTSTLGADWVPYLEPFFTANPVSYLDIQYMDVARGAFPSYRGRQAPDNQAGGIVKDHISYDMPNTVKIPENTRVIVLVTLDSTGEIIAADELSYDSYTFESGVKGVESGNVNMNASVANGILNVYTTENASVEVYNIDGTLLLSADAQAGDNNYRLNGDNKILIVKINGETASKTLKLMTR